VLPVVLVVLNFLLIVSVVSGVVVFSRHGHKLTKSVFDNNNSSLDKAACNDDDVDVNDVIVKAVVEDYCCADSSGPSSEHQQQQQQQRQGKQSAQVGPRQFDIQSPTH
jgi:Na+-transporting NADH:ubiquinone oxidoreductase subunit NqrC